MIVVSARDNAGRVHCAAYDPSPSVVQRELQPLSARMAAASNAKIVVPAISVAVVEVIPGKSTVALEIHRQS